MGLLRFHDGASFKTPKSLWVWWQSAYRRPKAVWVRNNSAWESINISQPSAATFTASVSQTTVTVVWDVSNASSVRLALPDGQLVNVSLKGSYTWASEPGGTPSFQLLMVGLDTSLVATSTVRAIVPAMKAPTLLAGPMNTTGSTKLTWTPVALARGYTLRSSSGLVYELPLVKPVTFTPYTDYTVSQGFNTKNTWTVRGDFFKTDPITGARVDPLYFGPESNGVVLARPKERVPDGDYYFPATSAFTWQEGEPIGGEPSKWFSSTSLLYIGDGGVADKGGVKTTYFFYGADPVSVKNGTLGTAGIKLSKLINNTITRGSLQFTRATGVGSSGKLPVRMQAHAMTAKPASSPQELAGQSYNPFNSSVTFAPGGKDWINLPISWVDAMRNDITDGLNPQVRGFAMGGLPTNYMAGSRIAGQGLLRVTVKF